jgi:hypothetical protein
MGNMYRKFMDDTLERPKNSLIGILNQFINPNMNGNVQANV